MSTDAAPAANGPASVNPTPLTELSDQLPKIIEQVTYSEMWGVELTDLSHVPTKVVLQKFLRANDGNAAAAAKQLTSALEWRKKMQPHKLATQTFDKKKFDELGFVTSHADGTGKNVIINWSIYGAVKNKKLTFGDVDEFIKWRAATMELSVQKLKLNEVTEPIPEDGTDPYQLIQVHDYFNVRFFRMEPEVRAASKETISVFSMAYPELLAHKYFVNVPSIMGWMFGAMKLFLAPATLRKFHPMTSGATLATELPQLAGSLPKEYGGMGPSVKEGLSVQVADFNTESIPEPIKDSEAAVQQTKDKSEDSAEVSPTATAEPDKPAELATTETQPADVVVPSNQEKEVKIDDHPTYIHSKPAEGSEDTQGTSTTDGFHSVDDADPKKDADPKEDTTAAVPTQSAQASSPTDDETNVEKKATVA